MAKNTEHYVYIIDLGDSQYVCNGNKYSSLDNCYKDLQKYFNESNVLIRKANENEIAYWKWKQFTYGI